MSRPNHGVLMAIFGLLVTAVPVLAHHSISSEYDPKREFAVTGLMTRVEWSNPHIFWYVEVKDAKSGKVDTWAFEGNPPATYRRAGLKKADWKTGEVVTVTAIPAKDGTKTLGFGKMIKYPDGHVIVLRVGGE